MLNPIDFSIIKIVDMLPDRVLDLVESLAAKQSYKRGQNIERYGGNADRLWIIQSGLVRLGLDGVDGSRFNLSIFGPGSSFGETALFLDLPVQFDALCESDVTLASLDKDQVEKLLVTEPEFMRAALNIAYTRSHTMLNYIGNFLKEPLQVRTALLLTQMLNGENDDHTVYCRQADLAHALGVSRVSVSKALKSLQAQGLIERAYGKILIPSKSKLVSLYSSRS